MKIKNALNTILILLILISSCVKGQDKPLIIGKLTKNLFVYTTYNDFNGKRYSANAMYLVTDDGVVLFDTPWDQNQYQPLLDSIQKNHSLPVIAVFASHSHEDRSGGFEYYNQLGIPTYATKETNSILRKNDKPLATNQIELGKEYNVGGERFVIEFFGEGHTSDNTVVWFPEYKILNGGCLVKSAEAKDLGYLGEANLEAWSITIHQLINNHPNIKKVIPGHDNWKLSGSLKNTLYLLNHTKDYQNSIINHID